MRYFLCRSSGGITIQGGYISAIVNQLSNKWWIMLFFSALYLNANMTELLPQSFDSTYISKRKVGQCTRHWSRIRDLDFNIEYLHENCFPRGVRDAVWIYLCLTVFCYYPGYPSAVPKARWWRRWSTRAPCRRSPRGALPPSSRRLRSRTRQWKTSTLFISWVCWFSLEKRLRLYAN